MSFGKLIALFNHPVTQALFDVGQYTVQRHILPALNRTSAPPGEAEVQDTASEYATSENDTDMAQNTEETHHETPSGNTHDGNAPVPRGTQ
ncbi:hypothetical protein [Enterobacter mori]|uniref:hypothetical protein n=1 Tax=Enterobacter mori TaxID=539813 RepID=UPI003B84487F